MVSPSPSKTTMTTRKKMGLPLPLPSSTCPPPAPSNLWSSRSVFQSVTLPLSISFFVACLVLLEIRNSAMTQRCISLMNENLVGAHQSYDKKSRPNIAMLNESTGSQPQQRLDDEDEDDEAEDEAEERKKREEAASMSREVERPRLKRDGSSVLIRDSTPHQELREHICSWENNATTGETSECLKRRIPLTLEGGDGTTNPILLFFGDSTMARVWWPYSRLSWGHTMPMAVNGYCNCNMKVLDRCWRSGDKIVAKVYEREFRRDPVKGKEGPTAYGLKYPGCMDCRSCHSRLWFCSKYCYRPPSFFGVEFARDTTLQTRNLSTTQETVAELLEDHFYTRRPAVVTEFDERTNTTTNYTKRFPIYREKICVVNAGMHDMTIPKITPKTFMNNVIWYLRLLQPHCDHLIWINLSWVIEKRRYPQKNRIVEDWNDRTERVLLALFPDWATVLDIYNISSTWPHENPIHLRKDYYDKIASILADSFLVETDYSNG